MQNTATYRAEILSLTEATVRNCRLTAVRSAMMHSARRMQWEPGVTAGWQSAVWLAVQSRGSQLSLTWEVRRSSGLLPSDRRATSTQSTLLPAAALPPFSRSEDLSRKGELLTLRRLSAARGSPLLEQTGFPLWGLPSWSLCLQP